MMTLPSLGFNIFIQVVDESFDSGESVKINIDKQEEEEKWKEIDKDMGKCGGRKKKLGSGSDISKEERIGLQLNLILQ